MTSRKNKPVFVSHSRTLEGGRNCPRDVSDASRWVGVLPLRGEVYDAGEVLRTISALA